MRQVLLYQDEEDWWVVEVPSLPGCVSQGRTRDEAITNIREAIVGYIETLLEHGDSVPEDRLNALLVAV